MNCGSDLPKTPPSQQKKFCDRKCYSKWTRKGRPSEVENQYHKKVKGSSGQSVRRIKKLLQTCTYGKEKHLYQDKIIDFPDSPTGKAYIGINKQPLMPSPTGRGYQGVLLQCENRCFILCNECGEWRQKITETHLQKCCGMTSREYKEKHGLNLGTGLVSDETSLRVTNAALLNKDRVQISKKVRKSQLKNRRGKKHSREYENRFEVCPAQLQYRLVEFIKCNRELPSQHNRGRTIYKALRRRYGSWGHALQGNGLPFYIRTGTNSLYVFPDGTKYKYNINQMHDREMLFHLIMQKCPVMHEKQDDKQIISLSTSQCT